MARDPVRIVLGVRQRAVEQARYVLGVCLRAEAEHAAKIRAIDDAAEQDRAVSRSQAQDHLFQEMFVRRQQADAAERRIALADLEAAQARSAEARAALAAARLAVEAVDTLLMEREAAAAIDAGRHAQHTLDDMARSRRGDGL